MKHVECIDLFCGIGGLSFGLKQAGITISAGLDIDDECGYPFKKNVGASFVHTDIAQVRAATFTKYWSKDSIRLLAGCAPCQPFSTYMLGKGKNNQKLKNEKWYLLDKFSEIVDEQLPDVVTMENVPQLSKQTIFHRFLDSLNALGYYTSFSLVDCSQYGIPQKRIRLVLLASRLGAIKLLPAIGNSASKTVREAIGHLPEIKAGETHSDDRLHMSSKLSPINQARIKQSKPAGTWRDWESDLVAECHKRNSGERYGSVYGRMSWDKPSPTITTQFYGYGNGRFGHPVQDRGLSLREGALLQTFPENYEFLPENQEPKKTVLGRLIGNAVPVRLGEVIGQSIINHLSHQ